MEFQCGLMGREQAKEERSEVGPVRFSTGSVPWVVAAADLTPDESVASGLRDRRRR